MWNSVPILQTISSIALIVTLVAGIVAAAAGAVGSWSGGRALDIQKTQSDERIALADRSAAEANAKAKKAVADAAIANEEVAKQKTRAAELEKQAAEIQLEAQRLKQTIAWRELGKQSIARLIKSASRHHGQLNLRYVDSDPEALSLAIQLSDAFNKAGWQVGTGAIKLPGLAMGVIVDTSSSHDKGALEAALRDANIQFVSQALPGGIGFNISSVNGPTLLVGSKPR